jgi:hypothetical protein
MQPFATAIGIAFNHFAQHVFAHSKSFSSTGAQEETELVKSMNICPA